MAALEFTIDAAFAHRDGDSYVEPRARCAKPSDQALELIDKGEARVAERQADGKWKVNQWLKKSVLLSFRLNDMDVIPGGPGKATLVGQGAVEVRGWGANRFRDAGFRAVPGAIVRRSAFIARNGVLMPSFVNLGDYVDEGTMVDTWSTVGSCAQIGKSVHISGGVGIGGVLEPLQAEPVIIEDDCFIGARSEVAEGVIVRRARCWPWACSSASRPRSSIAPPARSTWAKSRNIRWSCQAPCPASRCRTARPGRRSAAP